MTEPNEVFDHLNREIARHTSNLPGIQERIAESIEAEQSIKEVQEAEESARQFYEKCSESPRCVDKLLDEYRHYGKKE